MQDYSAAAAYIAALTQCDPNTALVDIRSIHDRDKAQAAHPRRGTLPELWPWIIEEQAAGRGIFVNISVMDGLGLHLPNVQAVRCQVVDLDGIDAPQQYQRIASAVVAPAFAVQTSPNKFHVYWQTPYHTDVERFRTIQRKLIQEYNGDYKVHDPSRVLRLPGTYHLKGAPHLITCWSLGSYGVQTPLEFLEALLAHVDISVSLPGVRQPLGSPELAAPSLDWIRYALADIDPNGLDRGEWTALIASVKQAGWTLADEPTLYGLISEWCARYINNNPAENAKEWNSYRDTQVGWNYLAKRSPNTHVLGKLRGYGEPPPERIAPVVQPHVPSPSVPVAVPPMPDLSSAVPVPEAADVGPVRTMPSARKRPADTTAAEILTGTDCASYFDGCVLVVSHGKIRTPDNRLLGPSEFNALYGGKLFVLNSGGKTTDEAWKAATRSTLWRVPVADHLRFLPSEPWGAMLPDAIGRLGLNVYYPITPLAEPGDITPFLRHLAFMFPDPNDQRILIEYMAHNAKYPGHKIYWAPVIQSTEGVGKTILREMMNAAIGSLYTHTPNAQELVDSGSKFNGWMLHKLFITVDEIKVDEKHELIERLKPLITEDRIEIQRKGADQIVEDNCANWMFFTNYQDAIPVNKDTRRFSVFYSALQCHEDLEQRQMGEHYFNTLFAWLKSGGYRRLTHYLLNYPIERGAIAKRAPKTSSMEDVLIQSRSPLEKLIRDAVDDKLTGFRGDYVSVSAVMTRVKQIGQMRTPSAKQIGQQLAAMGYKYLGRAPNLIPQEDAYSKPDLYGRHGMSPDHYAAVQGYR